MALSGSFSGSVFNGHHQVLVEWSATQNVANNTSTITAKLYYVHDWSISISARSSAHSVTIDGTTTTFSSSAIKADSGKHLIGTATKTINHNSDGTKSISMSASFALRATLGGTYYGNITASATITLDAIARASQPTVSASSVTMGNTVTITTNRASSSFTHTLEYNFQGATGTIATGVGASYAWKVPIELANSLTDAKGATLVITCKTYNGSTLIGSKTVTIAVNTPSLPPTISSVSCVDLYGYKDTFGAYIQGKSRLNISVTAKGVYGSTIKSYKIVANQTTYNTSTCTTDVLRRYGSQTVTITVTDSRGYSTSSSVPINVLQYTNPTISTLTAYRCLSDGTEDEAGAYVKVTIGASITSLESKNAKTFALNYKKRNETTYTAYKTWTTAYTLSTSVIMPASSDYSFDIQVQAIDSFGTVEAATAIGTSFTLMDFRNTGKGIAFGKASEQDAFECAIKAIMSGKVSIGGYENDSYPLATNGLISNEWLRTVGTCGWLNQTYGGGWYMNDANWIKAYADKGVSTSGTIKGGAVQTVAGADLDNVNTRIGTAETNIDTINSNLEKIVDINKFTTRTAGGAYYTGNTYTVAKDGYICPRVNFSSTSGYLIMVISNADGKEVFAHQLNCGANATYAYDGQYFPVKAGWKFSFSGGNISSIQIRTSY